MTDNRKLHNTFTLATGFGYSDCGCILRHDGERVRTCRECNPKTGTHFYGKKSK